MEQSTATAVSGGVSIVVVIFAAVCIWAAWKDDR
jgi:hypothetical protein